MKKAITELVASYLQTFPEESERLSPLQGLLAELDDSAVRRGDNEYGHITASGIVVSRRTRNVLLIKHKHLSLLLPPGGHSNFGAQVGLFEDPETPLATADREIREETGISELEHVPFHSDPDVPIDIDIHWIPERDGEPGHNHFDFRYFFLTSTAEDAVQTELTDLGSQLPFVWARLQELSRSPVEMAVGKIERLFDREFRVPRFYQRVCELALQKTTDRVDAIVVTHMLSGTVEYLDALQKLMNVRVVIPKPKSAASEVIDAARAHKFEILSASRDDLADPGRSLAILDRAPGRVVLFDVGGWFAPALAEFVRQRPGKIVGVVEDTENGHRRYQEVLGSGREPKVAVSVVSVARSPLKAFEDYLVGESVVFSADAILRDCSRLLQFMNCSVIGFGKIGRSIAQHLLGRGIKPSVYDINTVKRVAAYNQGCAIPPRSEFFRNSDVIFSATGSQATDAIDFRALKNGCFVFSVTSSDDEFKLRLVKSEYRAKPHVAHVERFTGSGNYFYLVNEGNAVNFIHKAVLGDFIHLVRAEMIVAEAALVAGEVAVGLRKVTAPQRTRLAEFWLTEMVDPWQQRGPTSGDLRHAPLLADLLVEDEDGSP